MYKRDPELKRNIIHRTSLSLACTPVIHRIRLTGSSRPTFASLLNLLILYCLGEFLCPSCSTVDLAADVLVDPSFSVVVDLDEGRADRIGVALTLAGMEGTLNTSCEARGVARLAIERDVGIRATDVVDREEGNRVEGVANVAEVVDRAILGGAAISAKEEEV